jgi:glycosyltransferase involved in cell wall biosynthesis
VGKVLYMKIAFVFVSIFYFVAAKLFSIFFKIKASKKYKSKTNGKNILYLAAFFPENAGYNWRCRKWADELSKDGFQVDIKIGITEKEFYGNLENNTFIFLILFLHRRFWQVVRSKQYDTVIVRRELLIFNDYGNLFLEKLLLQIHPNAILDFDDDLTASKNHPKKITNLFGKILRENGNKFNESLRLYNKFIVASNYLKEKVLTENTEIDETAICVIPTCVDYNKFTPKFYEATNKECVLGWIGSDGNYPMLDYIIPLLNDLSDHYNFKLIVVGGTKFEKNVNFNIEFIKWNLHSEVENVKKIDIGLMPLLFDDESKGKGAFKLIQYMGLGIVSIATPVTINCEIISHSENSFLAEKLEDWENILKMIFKNQINLNQIGIEARNTILNGYSFEANKLKYINFIDYVWNSRNF